MPQDSPAAPPAARAARVSNATSAVWRRVLLDYAPPLLLMAVIFLASQDIGSSAHSGRIISWVLNALGLGQRLTPVQFEAVHYAVRKAGHVTEFALLAVLGHRAVVDGGERWTPRLALGLLAAVSLYAASDEFHQRFVLSRTPSVWDWALDTVAAALALAVKWGWERRWRRQSSE
jgi:VanZ family protein